MSVQRIQGIQGLLQGAISRSNGRPTGLVTIEVETARAIMDILKRYRKIVGAVEAFNEGRLDNYVAGQSKD